MLHLLIKLLLVSFSSAVLAQANTEPKPTDTQTAEPISCGAMTGEQLTERLNDRLKSSLERQNQIQTLIGGKEILKVPPASLFAIDLTDPASVSRRTQELKAQVEAEKIGSAPDDTAGDMVVLCAKQIPELNEKLAALRLSDRAVTVLKLKFLTLSIDQRKELLAAQSAGAEQREQQKQLATAIDIAEKQGKEAEQRVVEAEALSRSAVDEKEKELASQRAIVEKARQDLAQTLVDRSKDLKGKVQFYTALSERLSALAGDLNENLTASLASKNYGEANEIWRMLVDKTFSEINEEQNDLAQVVPLPKYPETLLRDLGGDANAAAYKEAYSALKDQRETTVKTLSEHEEDYKKAHYKMLLQSSRIRSSYLQSVVDLGDASVLDLSDDYFLDLWREIRVVPYRIFAVFYAMIVGVKDRLTGGVAGILSLARDSFLLFLFLAIPVAVFLGLKRLTARIDRFRSTLLNTADLQSWRYSAAMWLKTISPYLPWVLMLFGIWIAEYLISNSDLNTIRDLFSYITYYIWYRIFKLFVAISLSRAAYSANLRALTALKSRIVKTTNLVSVFFFSVFVLLRVTEGTVGVALVYRIVTSIALYAGWAVLAYCAYSWRDQVSTAAARAFPKNMGEKVSKLCQKKYAGFFVNLPVVFCLTIMAVFRRFQKWLSKFEFYKKISVEILKRKLDVDEEDEEEEEAAKNRFRTAKAKYLSLFSLEVPEDSEILITPTQALQQKMQDVVTEWVSDGTDEFSLAVFGEKGSGKSTLLTALRNSNGLKSIAFSIPPKLTHKKQVEAFLAKNLEFDFEKGPVEKTLILIDDAHNLFLSELGGFDGYRSFLEIVNAKIPNTFWCVAYNRRAWKYLDNVIGRNQFYRNVFEVRPFSDVDIQNLIMTRHRKSGCKLEFDEAIVAASKSDEYGAGQHAEAQYFRLLWGLAKGNPRTALALWNASISMTSSSRVMVGIPKPSALRELNQLNEADFFVFGSILKHENLSEPEAIRTTNLPDGIVRNALKIGEDMSLLERSRDGRFRVSSLAQVRLIEFLMSKNIVYE